MMNSIVQYQSMVHCLFFEQANLLRNGVPSGIRTHDLQLRRLVNSGLLLVIKSTGYTLCRVPFKKTYPQFKPLNRIASLLSNGTRKHTINSSVTKGE